MRALIALAMLIAPGSPAGAQTIFDALDGEYGSAADPATSCAANPHQLDFLPQPPHATLTWAEPKVNAEGATGLSERYDILDFDDTSLTLRQDAGLPKTGDGTRPLWILRLTEDPRGYCWGRTDWPVVRCEDQQLRCDNPTS